MVNRATEGKGNIALQHEEAAHQKRNWVRLTYDCNDHCSFCLDSNAHDGTMRSNMDIKVQIIEGRRKGMQRLILSGGEPTIHPNYLDFIKLGKKAGYEKIQTVTNGRMFKYWDFIKKARENGLDEITFSIHGHTAKLHDSLVGSPGAFAEETQGLRNAMQLGFIVNIDVVINKQNVKHLPAMLDKFINEWGVKEFDLLHIIPFGNAWTEARHHLFYDLEDAFPSLQKAFEFARRPDVHIWLNRFPPPYTENFEDLIQDPYKMNDEVRGRREEYDKYLSVGKKLSCREPDRCHHCYMQNLCDTLDVALDTRKAEEVDVIRFSHSVPITGTLPRAKAVRLVGADLAEAKSLDERVNGLRIEGVTDVELELDDYTGLDAALTPDGKLFGKRVSRCYTASAGWLQDLMNLDREFEVVAFLTPETEAVVRGYGSPPARLALAQRTYDLVSDAHANDIDLKGFFGSYEHDIEVENVPACLLGGREPRKRLAVLDAQMLGTDSRIDMAAFTKRYVTEAFHTKAVRCGKCTRNADCRGVHINWVRAHGYAPLAPFYADGEGQGTSAPDVDAAAAE
jgi:MoaA/NifB/PqqE/SkfB family radical SAM enzyme